ncbi:protein farnesyltransferase subunit beta-like isoform X2 [Dendrobium catenatum]|uniref:protein farnesyltransferase subunit beta-like isoform X2 n=1 Tax=Dendrobium catenatum TaxID=906689 RepID=UPI00109FF948|nr:protein farnesyltransferase subunit beta-like isoform X2 [Dendrobium catenatum]
MESSPIDSSSNASSGLSSSTSSPPHSDRDHQQITLTVTQLEQLKVEEKVSEIYRILSGAPTHTQTLMLELWRDKHIEFLTRGLNQLGPTYRVLDANRPWLCYWIIHSMALLRESLDIELENNAVDFLSRCKLPHLATTYAAVNTLVTLGSNSALLSINREALREFLLRMKDFCGAFRHVSSSFVKQTIFQLLNLCS